MNAIRPLIKCCGGRVLLFVLVFAGLSTANAVPLPRAFDQAMAVYPNSGHRGFFNRLTESSLLAGDQKALNQARKEFLATVEHLGFFRGVEVLRCEPLGSRIRRVYFVIHCSVGAVFGKLDSYQQPEGRSVVQSFRFSRQSEEIFPYDFFSDPERRR